MRGDPRLARVVQSNRRATVATEREQFATDGLVPDITANLQRSSGINVLKGYCMAGVIMLRLINVYL